MHTRILQLNTMNKVVQQKEVKKNLMTISELSSLPRHLKPIFAPP